MSDEIEIDGDLPKDVKEAIQQIDHILEMIDEEVPEWALDRAPEFFESVSEGVKEVRETIFRRREVTRKQLDALDNWEGGVAAWIR